MGLIPLSEASTVAGVSVTTIRNYIRDKRLVGYEKSGKMWVNRDELMAVFGATPLARNQSDVGTRIIAVANQKGGAGKTTTALALAANLAKDASVLAIDCDPQGNMTQAAGFNPDEQEKTIYNVFLEETALADTFLRVGPPPPEFYLVPSNLDLSDTWRRVAGKVGLESILKTALSPVLSRFKFVVIDCPPSLDMTTINALVAATEIIVPVDMSVFSVRGMVKLIGTIQEVRKVNPNLPAPKILPCQTGNTNVSASIEEGLREKFGTNVFSNSIPRGKHIPEAHNAKILLPYYAPKSKTNLAYQALAEEVRCG